MQKNQFLFIISLIFAVFIALFALTNGDPVSVNLFFYEVDSSLALVILSSAVLGAIIVGFLGIAQYFKLRMEIRRLNKEGQDLTKKNQELEKLVKEAKDAQAAAAAKVTEEEKLDAMVKANLSEIERLETEG